MSKSSSSKNTLIGFVLIVILMVSLIVPSLDGRAASTVTVNAAVTYQVIDGFGASDAFHTGAYVRGDGSSLTPAQSQKIVELLFSPTTGAGLTIIRHEVGSSTAMVTGVPAGGDGDNLASIEPNNPGGPNATPVYVWNTSDPDNGQVWLTQQAQQYGPMVVIADAWSAPAYMKTDNALVGGGYLCGVPGAPTCASGDWRQHYANYLTQYVNFYKNAGITIAYIGFANEPELSPSYTGMNWDATNVSGSRGTINTAMPQDIDFIKNYLGPTLTAAGLTTKVSCCEATSWPNANTYLSGVLADSTARNYVGIATGHAYYSSPNGFINTPMTAATSAGKHVWETEASTFDGFVSAWDDGSDASGLTWAQHLWDALVNANVNGYLYWWFAQRDASNADNEDLIHLYDTSYTVTKRLWAFANYSRFIRPGATRIDATSPNTNLKITATKNSDGSYAIVVLNTATADEAVTFSIQGATFGTTATPYLTNASNDTAQQPGIAISAGSFTATVPARSLVTYSIPSGGPSPTPCPNCSPTPTPTRTRTPSITPTPLPGLRVQLVSGGTDNSQQSTFHYRLMNTGTNALSGLSARVYFTLDGSQAASNYVLEKYYDQSGAATVSGPTLATGSTYYFTVSYGSTSLAASGSWEFDTTLHLKDWSSNYSGSNDWWHTTGTLPTSYTDWPNIPAYLNGALTWGSEPPGGGGTPTSTGSPTRTPTRTYTPTGATSTPTRTSTRTNTPTGATFTPTRTATRTNTPTGFTATPTRSSTPSATSTSGATCSPVNATIAAPFTYDGAGTFCWQASSLGSYINSWNLATLTINGVDITNKYTPSSAYPAKINGYWYIYYVGNYSWSHFETK